MRGAVADRILGSARASRAQVREAFGWAGVWVNPQWRVAWALEVIDPEDVNRATAASGWVLKLEASKRNAGSSERVWNTAEWPEDVFATVAVVHAAVARWRRDEADWPTPVSVKAVKP